MPTPRRFSRRVLLRGAGVTLTLPLLDAMIPRQTRAAAGEPLRRMICINTTLGLHTPNLFPAQAGREYELTPYLEPIKEFRSDLTIFSGLSHPEVDGGHPAELCYLTSAPHPRADNFKNTISLDQYAVEQLVPDTRFGSLVLASSSSRGLSFTRSGVPIPAEERPSRVFKSMFVDGTPRENDAQVRRLKQGQSTMARTPSNWLNFALSKSSRCSFLESCSRSLRVPARQEVLCLTERSYFSAVTLVTQAATTTRIFQSSSQEAAFSTVNTSPLTQRKTHLFAISTCSSSVV